MSKRVELPPIYKDIEPLLRTERFPTIWCPACGLGLLLKTFAKAIVKSEIPPEKHVVVSGIGCAGRIAGYLRIDGYHVTHGRAIPFATGIKLAKPELEVSVISGDGDILSIGGNHFIHAARRNIDLNVIIINNFIYGMTGGQLGSTTPKGAKTMTSPYGNLEEPFNVPLLAYACGASFVARWTVFHDTQLLNAILKAFEIKGFSVIEVLSPCTIFAERNNLKMLELIKMLRTRTRVKHDAPLEELMIEPDKPIILGNFIERREKPSFERSTLDIIKKLRGE
ncbi:MAG: 2-oxoacid:ferredoxin oxidoreductase subunit beta [Thermoprotei archaeon]|nr:MAG: 2-oxoacid:ferredoxin oxidoreductase subunit beta [Thermoprotei archaeon]